MGGGARAGGRWAGPARPAAAGGGLDPAALARLQEKARNGENLFDELLETVKVASLGQISAALYEVVRFKDAELAH